MNRDDISEVISWLNDQIQYANEAIHEAHEKHNFGRESQYEGVRDALMRCLNKLKSKNIE